MIPPDQTPYETQAQLCRRVFCCTGGVAIVAVLTCWLLGPHTALALFLLAAFFAIVGTALYQVARNTDLHHSEDDERVIPGRSQVEIAAQVRRAMEE